MITGAEILLQDSHWIKKLKNKRVAYLGHSASVDNRGHLILSQLYKHKEIQLTSVFAAQHGFKSTKQANMHTSENDTWEDLKLYSLYSNQTRRLTSQMTDSFDVLLFDLQDVGCRIYTYLTTLFYIIEDCAKTNKTLIILDRPNPLARYVEGSLLQDNFHSFVGLAPIPMSHGLTLGELAFWYKDFKKLQTDIQLVKMKNYNLDSFWSCHRPWILPSPNMTSVTCATCYPGTVLLEGTCISEARGTTKPLEMFGHPQADTKKIIKFMKDQTPSFLEACFLRDVEFEPAYDKHKNTTCMGFQIHLEKSWASQGSFKPYRLMSLFLRAFKQIHPSITWKTKAPYEYEFKKDPIDIISGSSELQTWINASSSSTKQWDDYLINEEQTWIKQRKDFLIYK